MKSEESPGGTNSSERRRVLLAEDDQVLRRLLGVILERAGYEVVPASDGLEAIELLQTTPVDAVVTDATMPRLNGRELCRRIKNDQKLAHLPVILLSGVDRKASDANAEGADAFLSKPVAGETLVGCIEKLFAGKS
ncbi:MAG TPA: response regulator [Pyrinomonadaceae bacterium]|nr:response regulator [Pyrinomonadaceae bacterium]